ncbi:unnamed protein product [Prunus armeniaca]|uniref:Uncharacterized protein n=1 Tax=Prunus armeniaca TaxID=36596 RepID=A0A6J5WFM7_PRUAR|nr:unnamed protein product [Prunus armeniaca]
MPRPLGMKLFPPCELLHNKPPRQKRIRGRDMSKWINNDKKRWMRGTWLGIRQT